MYMYNDRCSHVILHTVFIIAQSLFSDQQYLEQKQVFIDIQLSSEYEISSTINRPISQTVYTLAIAINRAEHERSTVIIQHNYKLFVQS